MSLQIPLRVIIGPTAAGKSALALHLARERNLAIISADSRQIYKHFNIGTAKPDEREMALVPHYGIDVANADERYSAQKWARRASGWIVDAANRERGSVVVGGTGFYVRALVQPLAASPELDEEKRNALLRILDSLSTEELRRWCVRLDPRRSHLGRTQLYRAIETALLAGVRIGDVIEHDLSVAHSGTSHARTVVEQQSQLPPTSAAPLAVRYLVVDPGPVLAQRIVDRVDAMIQSGWVSEVRNLMQLVSAGAPAWLASGYGVMRAHAQGQMSLSDARERVVIETRQYAKRQRTWCRHQLREGAVTHISPDNPRALNDVLAWWDATEEHA